MGLQGVKTRTKTNSWEETKQVALSYLETLMLTQGESSTAGLESQPTTQEASSGHSAQRMALNAIQQLVTAGLGGHNVERQTTIEKSGWTVKGQFNVTKWDKARYAIGIKEIGAWAYDYAAKSGFVSIPFRTPKPIGSVSLKTDEIIPREFNRTTVQPWIRYWLAFNESQNWFEIAPANAGAFNLIDGQRVPQVIHVNSGIPPSERDPRSGYADFDVAINQVRLKAIFERPSEFIDSTPVLKGYRLKIVLRSGL